MSARIKQWIINGIRSAKLQVKGFMDNAIVAQSLNLNTRRAGMSSTGMALAVLMLALVLGAVVGGLIAGLFSFLQPSAPFLFTGYTIVNYTIVPIGFVFTAVATLPILVWLARYTKTDVASP